MYKIKNSFIIVLTVILTLVISCKDLDELNINPNGVDPEQADLNLLMATIITGVSQSVVSLGYGDIAGVMQHTQKDGWSGGHNDYDWGVNSKSWAGYYGNLRNIDEFYNKSDDSELDFHKGVALVLEAYTFGFIADLWGDAPYSAALNGEAGGEENLKPVFDTQKDIYLGILADLETANTLLSQDVNAYSGIIPSQDVLYGGNVSKWRKFANSLALRYYMRLSEKEPGIAEQGINNITSNPVNYPLITDASDDANVSYIGASPSDSWPTNTVFDQSTTGSYFRVKMCATLVEAMQALNDPRLAIWANKIEYALVLEPGWEDDRDEIIGNERHFAQNIADDYAAAWNSTLNYDPEWVGIPPSLSGAPQYNLNPYLEQAVYNPHVSQLNDMYKETSGPLLLSRMMSASEVHFILSEAALKGWDSGDAETHYNAGVQQSLNAWGVGAFYGDYIAGAPFAGLEEIMEQKWIASWTAAAEAWFDYRRTGLPDLQTGETAKRQALPLRFYYHMNDEISLNPVNAEAAIELLETSSFTAPDDKNSAWSKMWVLQGTGKPY
jgi:hypothetical protein